MRKGILPGTFSPPTLGHFDLIQRASRLCQELVVAIIDNPNKPEGLFSFEEKDEMLTGLCRHMHNVKIMSFKGLLVDFVKEQAADCIIRGLRSQGDFAFEEQMAVANRAMSGAETVFLLTAPAYAHISSTLTREIGAFGRRLHEFIPEPIEAIVYEKIVAKSGRRPDGV